jgi:hypothetical protein
MSNTDHCWHGVAGVVLDMNPPIYPVQCCWCGIRGSSQASWDGEQMPGHGPEVLGHPARHQPEGPCPKREP